MIQKHIYKNTELFIVNDSEIMAELDTLNPKYVCIGILGGNALYVDPNEWEPFVELVQEIDKRIKELKQ